MYNKVILVGNLTRDIEVRYSQSELAIANTAIATSRKFKSQNGEQKEEVCFTCHPSHVVVFYYCEVGM